MEDSPSHCKNDRRSRSSTRSPSNSSSKSSAVSRSATSRSSGHKSSQELSMSRAAKESLKIVEVANLAPQATRGQLKALFGYVGKIEDIRLYPTVDIGLQLKSKICFVKFYSSKSVATAQHLTNTVFMDQALIVIPYADGDIPDETTALELLTSGSLLPGIADPKLPQHVTSQLEGIPPLQVVVTKDPKLAEKNLPEYPPLPPTADWRKIEEIRRTVDICNIDNELTAQDVMDFFSKAGEIKYLRFCTRDNDPLTYAMIEFSEQPSVLQALGFNGQYLGSKMIWHNLHGWDTQDARRMRQLLSSGLLFQTTSLSISIFLLILILLLLQFLWVYHATQAITKPQAKTNEAAQKEIEEAMTRHAENLLAEGLDTIVYSSPKEKRRGRSKRKSRSRRSRSPIFRVLRQPRSGSRKRSSSRSRKRSSSKSRGTSSRHRSNSKAKRSSRSRSRSRRRSRTRKRSRSAKADRSRKSRSRSHSRRSRSRSRISRKHEDKKKSRKDKDRNKDTNKQSNKNKDHGKQAANEGDVHQTKESKSSSKPDTRGRSPKSESKKGRSPSHSRSHSRKISSSSHEKKRSKSNKKKKDSSDREFSMGSIGHSSQEKQ